MTTQAEQVRFIRDEIANIGFEERRAIAKVIEALQNRYTVGAARALLLETADKLTRKAGTAI